MQYGHFFVVAAFFLGAAADALFENTAVVANNMATIANNDANLFIFLIYLWN